MVQEVIPVATSPHEGALIRLMRQYEKEVLKVCTVYLRDLTLAEDATQETFFKAYKAMDRFQGGNSEKTWLMRIAINTCKDIRRGAWFRHTDRSVSLDKLPEPAVPPQADSVLITLEVMRLPAKEREVVLLRYYQNMTLAEVAQVLGISATAVAKRLKKAHEHLDPVLKGGEEHV